MISRYPVRLDQDVCSRYKLRMYYYFTCGAALLRINVTCKLESDFVVILDLHYQPAPTSNPIEASPKLGQLEQRTL